MRFSRGQCSLHVDWAEWEITKHCQGYLFFGARVVARTHESLTRTIQYHLSDLASKPAVILDNSLIPTNDAGQALVTRRIPLLNSAASRSYHNHLGCSGHSPSGKTKHSDTDLIRPWAASPVSKTLRENRRRRKHRCQTGTSSSVLWSDAGLRESYWIRWWGFSLETAPQKGKNTPRWIIIQLSWGK